MSSNYGNGFGLGDGDGYGNGDGYGKELGWVYGRIVEYDLNVLDFLPMATLSKRVADEVEFYDDNDPDGSECIGMTEQEELSLEEVPVLPGRIKLAVLLPFACCAICCHESGNPATYAAANLRVPNSI